MSVQFGRCHFDGKPVDPRDLDEVRPVLVPYGPDGESFICKDNFAILYRGFCTTTESSREVQPHLMRSGGLLTWDGRLDNREELIHLLADEIESISTDLEIVGAAYERWGTDSFGMLIGDWALSVWDSTSRTLILAKDFIGTRPLYYQVHKSQVTWCSVLDPLVLFGDTPIQVNEEYIAGWLSLYPADHLTPYTAIQAVSPSCFVRLANGTQRITRYWEFNHSKTILYRTDGEYEEHFRTVFSLAVGRRLRSESPVLAELSGGLDSSSIVCMADRIIAEGAAITPRLDTVSYFDQSEPNLQERTYFSTVEQGRGRIGVHIDVASRLVLIPDPANHFLATPYALQSDNIRQKFGACLKVNGNRVVLSGIGGDEVLGGVPNAIPELADLFVEGDIARLTQRLISWALALRRPVLNILWELLCAFLPCSHKTEHFASATKWLTSSFIRNHKSALHTQNRLAIFGLSPSFQENLHTLAQLRRQFGCISQPNDPVYELRYPYLDRSLLEFLYAIPREQIIRPGQRRSLMRRALVQIVPDAVLNQRRKAFVEKGPLVAVVERWEHLVEVTNAMVAAEIGIVDSRKFVQALAETRSGDSTSFIAISRTLFLEYWLRNFTAHNNGTNMNRGTETTRNLALQLADCTSNPK